MNTLAVNNNRIQAQSFDVVKTNINIEQLFELAIEKANAGNKQKAAQIARESLMAAKQSNNYIMVYIHSFLANLCIENQQYTSARIHIYNAQNRLDKRHFNYQADNEFFETLMKKINSLDIQNNVAA